MRLLAVLVGLIIAAMGILGMAAPTVLLDFAEFVLTQIGLYVAAAVRVAFGIVLIAAAPVSRLQRTVRVLGILFIVAGIIAPFAGVERVREIVAWWTAQGPIFMRAWAAIPVVLGVFIIHAFRPGSREAVEHDTQRT